MLASYTTLPLGMLRRGIEPLRSCGPAVLQTTAFPLGHLSKMGPGYSVFKQQKERSPNRNLTTVSEAVPLLSLLTDSS